MSDTRTHLAMLGGGLIRSLHHLIHTSRIHQDNNQLMVDGVSNCIAILADLSKEGDTSIQIWRRRFYINGEKLFYQRDTIALINEMADYFTQRQIGGLRIHSASSNSKPKDIVTLVHLLDDSLKQTDPREWLHDQLFKRGILWIEISKKLDETPLNQEMKLREKAIDAYFQALHTVKTVAEKASKGIAGVRKARRLAQTIVDLIQEDNSIMLALATIQDYDDYTYTHSVNVAMLATCLGKYIGLSQLTLEHLSVCGLFHDLGKVGIPKGILLKEGALNDEEWSIMRRHPIIGVRKIIRLNAPQALRSKIILGPFEHHLNPDLSGYPHTYFMKNVSLLGKILRIADVYEALTSERIYRPRAFTPDEALRRMWSEAGKNFDPILLKCFITMMGIYPIGSIVELQSGELGMVIEYLDESRKDLPLIALLQDNGNGSFIRGEQVNLASQDESSRRAIVKGIHASSLGIQPMQFILQDTPPS